MSCMSLDGTATIHSNTNSSLLISYRVLGTVYSAFHMISQTILTKALCGRYMHTLILSHTHRADGTI